MTRYHERREALLTKVGCEAYLVVDLARLMPKQMDNTSLYYLSGYDGEGVLIITAQESILLADERYFEAAKAQVGHDLTVRPAKGNYLADIQRETSQMSIKELSFTSNRITYSLFERLRQQLGIELTPCEDPVLGLRMVKDASEIERMRNAVRIAESCLTQLVQEIRIGMSEKQIAQRLDILMLEAGAEPAFEGIVAAGENCFNQHHKPSDRPIRREDFLLIDFGAKSEHYVSDITRTFVVGEATPRSRALYEASKRATEIGNESLLAGATLASVWSRINEHFAKSEFAPDAEVSGHCLGLELHEPPFLGADAAQVLIPGMVTTMEPGIYVLGYGGVRIEDDVLITEGAPDVLTSFTRELTIVG